MDFEQVLQGCGDSLEKLCALADSIALESDRAWAEEDKDLIAQQDYRFSRLCEYARETLSPSDWHLFRLKTESLQKFGRPPLG